MSKVTLIASAVLAAALAGCEAQPKQVDMEGRVLLEGQRMGDVVRLVSQTSDRIEGGLLRVRTLIKNRTKENLWVDVQLVWKDKDGYELYTTNWEPWFLPARLETTHEVASMRAGVADYEFRMRRAAKTAR